MGVVVWWCGGVGGGVCGGGGVVGGVGCGWWGGGVGGGCGVGGGWVVALSRVEVAALVGWCEGVGVAGGVLVGACCGRRGWRCARECRLGRSSCAWLRGRVAGGVSLWVLRQRFCAGAWPGGARLCCEPGPSVAARSLCSGRCRVVGGGGCFLAGVGSSGAAGGGGGSPARWSGSAARGGCACARLGVAECRSRQGPSLTGRLMSAEQVPSQMRAIGLAQGASALSPPPSTPSAMPPWPPTPSARVMKGGMGLLVGTRRWPQRRSS